MYRSRAKNWPRHGQGTIFKLDHKVLQNPCKKVVLVSLYEIKNSENPCLKPVSFSIYRDTSLRNPCQKNVPDSINRVTVSVPSSAYRKLNFTILYIINMNSFNERLIVYTSVAHGGCISMKQFYNINLQRMNYNLEFSNN